MKRLLNPAPLSPDQKRNARIAQALCLAGLLGFGGQMLYFYLTYGGLSDYWCVFIYWIVFIMPGYWANAMMVVVGGGRPLDGERLAKDGRPLFGPGKTLRGFVLGPFLGMVISMGIHGILFWKWPSVVQAVYGFCADPNVNYTFYGNDPERLLADLSLYLLGNPAQNASIGRFFLLLPRVLLCAYGAAIGDLFGSWAKRRRDIHQGKPFWIVDQLDFLMGCLTLAGGFVFLPISKHVPHVLIMLFIITPSITVLANNVSFLLGKKKVPW